METLSREEVRQMLKNGSNVSLVETLPNEYFSKFHLPGAINVPVDDEFEQNIQKTVPDKSRPVIVYCMDVECDAATTAASRMEQVGYQNVFRYEAGKVDWKEAGFPVEH